MTKTTATDMPRSTPRRRHAVQKNTAELGEAAKRQFIAAVLTMSWQLAVAILLPVIGGVELDKALGSKDAFLFVGLAVALLGSVAVMRRAMQVANRIPVPKLTAAQKRAIQKSYEEEDDD